MKSLIHVTQLKEQIKNNKEDPLLASTKIALVVSSSISIIQYLTDQPKMLTIKSPWESLNSTQIDNDIIEQTENNPV